MVSVDQDRFYNTKR